MNFPPFFCRNTDTLIHLLKSSLGTGILAMPVAFHHAGYLVGSIGTVVLGMVAVYCIHMLLGVHYELCKRKRVSRTNQVTLSKTAGPDVQRMCICNCACLYLQISC